MIGSARKMLSSMAIFAPAARNFQSCAVGQRQADAVFVGVERGETRGCRWKRMVKLPLALARTLPSGGTASWSTPSTERPCRRAGCGAGAPEAVAIAIVQAAQQKIVIGFDFAAHQLPAQRTKAARWKADPPLDEARGRLVVDAQRRMGGRRAAGDPPVGAVVARGAAIDDHRARPMSSRRRGNRHGPRCWRTGGRRAGIGNDESSPASCGNIRNSGANKAWCRRRHGRVRRRPGRTGRAHAIEPGDRAVAQPEEPDHAHHAVDGAVQHSGVSRERTRKHCFSGRNSSSSSISVVGLREIWPPSGRICRSSSLLKGIR